MPNLGGRSAGSAGRLYGVGARLVVFVVTAGGLGVMIMGGLSLSLGGLGRGVDFGRRLGLGLRAGAAADGAGSPMTTV